MKKVFCVMFFMFYLVFSHGMAYAQDKGLCGLSKSQSVVNDDLNGDGIINEMDCLLSYVLGLLDAGIDNIEMSKNPKMLTIMSDFFSANTMVVNGLSDYTTNLKPCISLIDDDVKDYQIPSSYGEDTFSYSNRNYGGFFSVLLPMTLSLKAKYNKTVPVGLACEGHRVGLTSFLQTNDDYTMLNTNGNAVKWLHENMGWNVLNHSMTAQLPQRAYFVDGINSALAGKILSQGYYAGFMSFSNTMVIDRLTGKWWEVNSTKTEWVERTPTKKYAQPFYREYINEDDPTADHNGPMYFNRDFDFEYSWGEWFKRAEELGLPFEKVIVHNGSTTSPWTIFPARKYAYFSVNTRLIYNNPPIPAAVSRTTTANSASNNVWNDTWVANNKTIVDNCKDGNCWIIFMSHMNDQTYNYNYYASGKTYPSPEQGQPELRAKDVSYPKEWMVPLKNEEILDIIGENVHDYINHPPSRLGISTWDEWHPAGGTQLAAFYYILDYAMSLGIDVVTPMEGWKTHGNILNLGVDRNGQTYVNDNVANQTPYTDEEKSYLTIGADMSIRYSFNPADYTDLSSSDITISPIAEVVYNGSPQTPEVIVRDGEIPLFNGIHYTVSYSNNINAGTATVTVTGKGHYTGTKTTNFTIKKNSVDITVNSYGKGTYCCNEDLDFSGMGDDLKAYVATGFNPNTGTIWMTRVYDVPKGTGIFLMGKEGSYSVPTTRSTSYYRNMLVGTLDETYIPSSTDAFTNFYLTVENDELKFCRIAGAGRTMSANRAYLQIPNNISNRPETSSVSSEEITISEFGKSTYCSENGLDFSGVSGLKAYTATGYTHETGTIWMTRVSDVPSGTGMFLLGAPGVYDIPTTTYDAQHKKNSYYENMLTGVLESIWVPSSTEDATNYYLTEENGVLKFCRIAGEGRTMSANRSYLQIPSSVLQADSRQLTLHSSAASADNNDISCNDVIGVQLSGYDDTTGITEIEDGCSSGEESDYYNLNGQKVSNPGKGIYIKNKKKIVSR